MPVTQTNRPAGARGMAVASPTRLGAITVDNETGAFTVRLLAFYVFLLVSRVLDLSPIWWMHIPLMAFVLLLLMTLARGGVKEALDSKISHYFGLFTLWVVACYPFSSWRGATLPLAIDSVEFFLVFLMIVKVVKTPEAWRTIAGGYGYAVVAAALYGFLFARSVDGRLALVGGTFGDPNGFALSILIGAPFLWANAAFSSSFKKMFYMACSALIFIAFAKAGSRGGLLALGTMITVMFIFSTMKQRMLICVVAVIGVAAAATLLPSYLRARYFTIFSPASSSAELDASSRGQLESDIESSGERRALLEQSIHMSFEHPIFGVGPGVFPFAAWDERKAETGVGGPSLVTHNTYTQISSECGLPGFFFFISAVFLCVKYTLSDFLKLRRIGSSLATLPRNLLLAFSGLLVGIFFLSTAYSHFLAIFMALAASLHNVVNSAIAQPIAAQASSVSPTQTASGLPKALRAERRPARVRIPSYLRPRGVAPTTAVEDRPNSV